MASVIDHYGDNQDVIIANAGPGHWNDPDMVRIFYLRHFINLIQIKLIKCNDLTWICSFIRLDFDMFSQILYVLTHSDMLFCYFETFNYDMI